ncbi:MAG: hypothetical protein AAF383_16760 [Cyanobacteria bacterium P01_A01_bin.83]
MSLLVSNLSPHTVIQRSHLHELLFVLVSLLLFLVPSFSSQDTSSIPLFHQALLLSALSGCTRRGTSRLTIFLRAKH